MCLVVEALDGRLFDRPVHSLDLPVGPGMARFGQAMLYIEISAGELKGMAAEEPLLPSLALDIFLRCPIALIQSEVRSARR